MTTLFQPYDRFKIKNRAAMAPMTRYDSNNEGVPSESLSDYYIRRAKNNVGLIIVESAAVNNADAMGYKGGLQFHNRKHLKAWVKTIDKIHHEGCKVIIQLFHAGRLTVPEITKGKVVAPSAINAFNSPSFWRPAIDGEVVHFQTKTPYPGPV